MRGYITKIGADSKKISQNRLRIVKALNLCKCNVDKANEVTNMTPLHWAVFNDDEAVVNELL